MEERFYTIDQVAELFAVTRAAVYKWMKAGQLQYVLVGAHRRIPQSALRAFVKEGNPDDVKEESSGNLTPGLVLACTVNTRTGPPCRKAGPLYDDHRG